MLLIHPFTHTDGNRLPCKVPTSSSGAIGGQASRSRTLRHSQGGIEPATRRLPDDCSYLLSRCSPTAINELISAAKFKVYQHDKLLAVYNGTCRITVLTGTSPKSSWKFCY